MAKITNPTFISIYKYPVKGWKSFPRQPKSDDIIYNIHKRADLLTMFQDGCGALR